jgi:hypothetical protein
MRMAALGRVQDPYLISCQWGSFIAAQSPVEFLHPWPPSSGVRAA